MIHNVKIINYTGDELVMDLRNPEKSGFLIYNITGIGPEKADIRTTDIVTSDGGIYNSSRLPSRNIVLSLRFFAHGEKTVEEIRHESYKFFPIKKPLTLIIETDNRIGEIVGYVESNEPVIFTSEVHTSISLICPYPFFYDGGPNGLNVTTFSGVYSMFEFPFSNESLANREIIMGSILFRSEELITYSGDSEVGITMYIDAIGEVRHLTIYNVKTRERFIIDTDKLARLTGKGMIAGDSIIVSTVTGNKSVTLLRNGVYTNILNAISRDSDWFRLSKGDNIFAFEAEYGTTNLYFRIENRTVYEGV